MPDETPDVGPEPAGPEGVDTPSGEGSRRDDGLDYARSARKAAGSGPGKAPRRRTGGDGFRRRAVPKSSGAHPDDRDPQLLDSAMSRMISQHGWELDLRVQAVFGRWAELVGDEVASHCTPETLAETRLIVRTDSTAWATQLRMMAPQLVALLNEHLGDGTVSRVAIRGPDAPSWKKGRRAVRDGRGPRDTYG
jgi:predicted nucleic acid-binding Zn ribbon protein